MVVVAVWLHEVHDVESIDLVLPDVLDSEKVPLRVALCRVISLKVQVILLVADFDDLPQVATLEPALKE